MGAPSDLTMGCGGSDDKEGRSGPAPAPIKDSCTAANRFRNCPDVVQYGSCADSQFESWLELFREHRDDKEIGFNHPPEFKLRWSRNQCVDEESTELFRGVQSENE